MSARTSLVALALAAPLVAQGDLEPFAHDNVLLTQLVAGVVETDFDGDASRSVTGFAAEDDIACAMFDPYGRLFLGHVTFGGVIAYDEDFEVLGTFTAGSNMGHPVDMALSAAGNLYVADNAAGVVFELDVDDQVVQQIGLAHGLDRPTALAVAPNGLLYVAQTETDEIMVFTPDDALVRRIGVGTVDDVTSLVVHDDVLIVGTFDQGILRFALDGGALDPLVNAGVAPDVTDVAIGPDGNLWATLGAPNDLLTIDPETGAVLATRHAGGFPTGLAFVPWWFRAKLRGEHVSPEEGLTRLVDTDVALAWWPGAGEISIGLGATSAPSRLVDDFGTWVWQLRGFEPVVADGPKRRVFSSIAIAGDLSTEGVTLATGRITGKPRDDGRFDARKLFGTISKSTHELMFTGRLQTRGKPLN